MRFGERLKQQRNEHNLTQGQIAKKLSITQQTVSSWENEKSYPDINSLIKISDFYGISLDTLLKEDTGMREYMEKNNVQQGLKPIKKGLLIIDALLIMFYFGDRFTIQTGGALINLVLIIVMWLNAYLILKLSNFEQSNALSIKVYGQRLFAMISSLKYLFVLLIFIVIAGIIFISLFNFSPAFFFRLGYETGTLLSLVVVLSLPVTALFKGISSNKN